MIELNTASAAGLWGSGLDRAVSVADSAEHVADRALGGAGGLLQQNALQDLAAGSGPVLLVLAIGLALWLVGDRLFRPASSLLGAAVGACLGLWASTLLRTPDIGGVPTAYVTIGLGSLTGLVIGAAMYRVAIGAAGGVVLAGAAAAVAVAVSLHNPGADGLGDRPETSTERSGLVAEAAAGDNTPNVTAVGFGEATTTEFLRDTAGSARSLLQAEWDAVPESLRPLAMAAAILGGIVGFAAGLLRPRAVGPAVAAMAGAAIWLGATTVLLSRTGTAPMMPTDQPMVWLGAWLGVAAVGFVVQRRVGRTPPMLAARD